MHSVFLSFQFHLVKKSKKKEEQKKQQTEKPPKPPRPNVVRPRHKLVTVTVSTNGKFATYRSESDLLTDEKKRKEARKIESLNNTSRSTGWWISCSCGSLVFELSYMLKVASREYDWKCIILVIFSRIRSF